jgi:hypothetical protein
MNREQNRPGSGRQSQNPSSPSRPGKSEVDREEEEEEESGGRSEQDEESSPMGQRDPQSNRGTPGNQGRRGMDD